MPLTNAHAKHIVTIEGPFNGGRTHAGATGHGEQPRQPVRFCTPGFCGRPLTGACQGGTTWLPAAAQKPSTATSAAAPVINLLSGWCSASPGAAGIRFGNPLQQGYLPAYFQQMAFPQPLPHQRLTNDSRPEKREGLPPRPLLGGGTDLLVQMPGRCSTAPSYRCSPSPH